MSTEPMEVAWLYITEKAKQELDSYMESNEDTGKIIALKTMGFG